MRLGISQFRARPADTFDEFAEQVAWHVGIASRAGCDMLLFPEYFTSGLLAGFSAPGESAENVGTVMRSWAQQFTADFQEMLKEFARSSNMYIIGGSHFYYHANDRKYYNSCFMSTPDGAVMEQRKTHRAYELVHNRSFMSPGDDLSVFDTPWCRMGVLICYDSAFPETARILALRGAELILQPSCVFDDYGVLRMKAYGTARAIENQCFVANSQLVGSIDSPAETPLSFAGESAIHSPAHPAFGPADGVLARTARNVEQVAWADLDFDTLREYRNTAVPNMLRERRPGIYGDMLRD